jgi:hypothetical protein
LFLFPTVGHIASAQPERNHWPGSLLSDAGLCAPLGTFSNVPRPKRRDSDTVDIVPRIEAFASNPNCGLIVLPPLPGAFLQGLALLSWTIGRNDAPRYGARS